MHASVSISFSFQWFFFYCFLALLLFQCSRLNCHFHCGHRVRESFYLHILTDLPDDSKSRCERTYPLHSDQMIQLTWIQFRMEKVHGHPIKCTTDFCILIFVTIFRFVVVHLFLWISWVDIPSCFFFSSFLFSLFSSHWLTAQCIQSEWSQTKQSSVKLIFFCCLSCVAEKFEQ